MRLGRKACAAVISNQLELQLQTIGVVGSANKAGVGIIQEFFGGFSIGFMIHKVFAHWKTSKISRVLSAIDSLRGFGRL